MPAAGFATRLGKLAGSKEMLPQPAPDGSGQEPACRRLLESFQLAGIRQVVVVLRPEKQDLVRYLEGRPVPGLEIELLPVPGGTPSVPHTLAKAAPSLAGRTVALGFPDVLFQPLDAFTTLIELHRQARPTATLGLFPAERPETTDMVDFGSDGRVRSIHPRPRQTELRFNWLLAVWGPAFTDLLVQAAESPAPVETAGELQLGSLFQQALSEGLSVAGHPFPQGSYRDIGTPEAYAAVRQR